MSTKIYNGYVLKNQSMHSLQKFILEIRKEIVKKATELMMKKAITITVWKIDQIACGLLNGPDKREWKKAPLYKAMDFIRERQERQKRQEIRDLYYDLSCEAVFIPMRTKILSLLYTEQPDFESIWDSNKDIEPYQYWNNTDQPEDIANKEWQKRCEDWDKVLGSEPPSNVGFTYSFINNLDLFMIKDGIDPYMKYVDSVTKRAKCMAKTICFNKYIQKNDIKIDCDDPVQRNAIIHKQAENFFKTKKGKEQIKKQKEKIKKKLKKITKDDLISLKPRKKRKK